MSDFTSEPFYKIISISRGDAGNYQCYARNEVRIRIKPEQEATLSTLTISVSCFVS